MIGDAETRDVSTTSCAGSVPGPVASAVGPRAASPVAGGAAGAGGFEDILSRCSTRPAVAAGCATTRRRAARSRRGRDLEADVHMSFDDALAGVRTKLRINAEAPCQTCHGSGAKPGTKPVQCSRCNGSGQVVVDQGPFAFAQPCPQCGGQGSEILEPCQTCSGSGTTVQPRELTVRVPAGVKDGAVIRVPGRGGAGANGGRAGDVLVRIHVEPHAVYGRRGDNVTIAVPLSYAEAALGTQLTVPTPTGGSKTIKVPAGTADGRTFRIRGEGAPKRGNGQGDLLVTVDLEVPEQLTRKQKQLVEQLAALDDHSAREDLFRRARNGADGE